MDATTEQAAGPATWVNEIAPNARARDRDRWRGREQVMMEVGAREIPGFNGVYFATPDGRVLTTRISCSKRRVVRELKGTLDPRCTGYFRVHLRDPNGKRTHRYVHWLILITFVGPCPPNHVGCHRNGNGRDNRASNLYWGTPQENAGDRDRHGRTRRGERSPLCKLTDEDVRQIRAMIPFTKTIDLAMRFGVSRSQINRVRRGRRLEATAPDGSREQTGDYFLEANCRREANDLVDRKLDGRVVSAEEHQLGEEIDSLAESDA